MERAAQRMLKAETLILARREMLGYPVDPSMDPYRTGMIGLESSELTTTIGDLAAKRTSTNKAFAALCVRYFSTLGLKRGDRIAVGASGSFPSILLAVLSACAETGVEPVVITSIGASEFGANIPGLSNAEMVAIGKEAGLWPWLPSALSPGGDSDLGVSAFFSLEPSDALRRYAVRLAAQMDIPLIMESSLDRSVAERRRIYEKAGTIQLFVNIGGANANVGNNSASLRLPAGLVQPEDAQRIFSRRGLSPSTESYSENAQGSEQPISKWPGGLAGAYLAEGVPVIHFLYIKGLAAREGIPIDADPRAALPAAIVQASSPSKPVLILCLLAAVGVLAFPVPKRRRRGSLR